MKPLSILLIICSTLFGLFAVSVIAARKGDRQANVLLGIFFLIWALDFLDGYLLIDGFYLEQPSLAMWNEASALLYGPVLYFYTMRILKGMTVFNWSFVVHLLPFALLTTFILVAYHSLTSTEKAEVLRSMIKVEQSSLVYASMIAVCLHFTGYILASKREVGRTDQRLRAFYSSYNIQWLNTILNALLLILLISLFGSLLQVGQSPLYLEFVFPLLITVMTFFILKVYWTSLRIPFVWLQEEQLVKYETSNVGEEEKEEIAKEIIQALEEQKVYLDPDLSLRDLAEKINRGERVVSQVINEMMEKSFFNLINTYRIEEAKRRFKENIDAKLTILEVVYQVGFNSKSSFNTQFKKQTGLTPTEFIRSI